MHYVCNMYDVRMDACIMYATYTMYAWTQALCMQHVRCTINVNIDNATVNF